MTHASLFHNIKPFPIQIQVPHHGARIFEDWSHDQQSQEDELEKNLLCHQPTE